MQHRTYFDSAEYILKSEHNSADIPEKQTETEHPRQASISQPFCAVPRNSKVCKDANKGFRLPDTDIRSAKVVSMRTRGRPSAKSNDD